jgi:hypothetical protein
VGPSYTGGRRWLTVGNKNPNSNGSKQIGMFPNFDRSEKYLPLLRKFKVKYVSMVSMGEQLS